MFNRQILHALLHLRELFGSIFNAVLDDLSVFHSDIVAFMFTVLWYLGLILLLLVPALVCEPELEIIRIIRLRKIGEEEADPVSVKLFMEIVIGLEMGISPSAGVYPDFLFAFGYRTYHAGSTVAVPSVTPVSVNS